MTEPNSEKPIGAENLVPPVTPELSERSRGEQFSIDLDKIDRMIKAMLTEELIDTAALNIAWAIRADLAEEYIDSLDETDDDSRFRQRAQFGVIIGKALIFESIGDTLRYLMELDTAEGFARRSRFSDVLDTLTEEIDSKVGELDNSPDALVIKLRRYLSFMNREFLRIIISEGVERDEFIDHIRRMIIDEDGNPDEVFKAIGLTA